MKPHLVNVVFCLLLFSSFTAAGELRTWTGSNGKKIEAEFIEYDSEKEIVHIRLKSGKEQRVRLDLFSEEDQNFVKGIGSSDNPFGDDSADENDSSGLSPGSREKKIAATMIQLLNERHVSGKTFDRKMAEQAIDGYIKSLDPMKLYFLQSDMDEFRADSGTLAEKIKDGDVTLGFNIFNRFLQRLEESVNIALEILDKPLDFTVDEEYIFDKKSTSYVKNAEELKDRWRKRIKYEILQLKTDSENTAKVQPVERLKRRYNSFRNRELKSVNDDVIELFLTKIAGSFDPSSFYQSAKTMENWKMNLQLRLEGIGATLSQEDGITIVKVLVPGGPAEKSGKLQIGDKIIGVGQGKGSSPEDIVDTPLHDVVKKVRGKKGTTVRLEVVGTDEQKRFIEIERDSVDLDAGKVQSEIFEVGKKKDNKPCKVGVIRFTGFYQGSSDDVKRVLRDFSDKAVDAVVLDLSGNGGGNLQETIKIVGLFIETGPVMQFKGRNDKSAQIRSDTDSNIQWKGPLVVLSSKFTYDTPLGAIKDLRRGLIVGDRLSLGNSAVKMMHDIGEQIEGRNSSNKLGGVLFPVSIMYRPSGESMMGNAVESDIILPSFFNDSDKQGDSLADKIAPTPSIPNYSMVLLDMVKTLQSKSSERTKKSKAFMDLEKEIERFKRIKDRKKVTLNEKKFLEEIKKYQKDDSIGEFPNRLQQGSKIVKDDYLDEVLAIAVDYVNLLP